MFTCGSIICVLGECVLSRKLTEEMAGVVLETLSNRKLFAFGIVLLLIQIAFFLIGGLVGELSMLVLPSNSSRRFCERLLIKPMTDAR